MKTTRPVIPLAMLLVLLLAPARLGAQTTAITYQGRLTDNGTPASGSYDLRFALYDAASGGSAVGGPVVSAPVEVTNGLFTVTLDFGPGVFTGAARWLELGVRTNGGADPHFILAPRQPITSAPYAVQAANAATAATVTGSVPAGSLTGTLDPARLPASVAVLTNASSQFTGALSARQLSGGTNHQLTGMLGGIGAGRLNTNQAEHAFIGGGYWNSIGSSASNAVVGGGNFNRIEADSWQAGIFTGNGNTIRTNARWSVIAGGGLNVIEAEATEAFIGAGRQHRLRAGGAFIGAGNGNIIEPLSDYAFIGAGSDNRIDTFSVGAVIAGGESHLISTNARAAVIGGGLGNRIETLGQQATIAGGVNNTVHSNGWGGAIGGGRANRIGTNAWFAVVPGGDANSADGKYGFAAGRRAVAAHDGAFVWADATDADFVSTGNNQLLLRASGVVGIGKNNPATALDVNGTVSATAFAGDGAALTGLNAGALQSGTVDAARIPNLDAGKLTTGALADARLSANVARLNSANTFNAGQTIVSGASAGKALVVRGAVAQSGNLQEWQAATTSPVASVSPSGVFTGSGAGLTSLNADQLGSGTVADARLSANVARLNTSPTFTGTVTAGAFLGDGLGLTNLNPASFTSGTFDPARIPDLDAAKITSGTLAEARLPAGVALLAGSPVFTGDVSAARLQVGTAHGLGGLRSTIAGGQNNTNLADYAGVGGGFRNVVQAGASYSRIGGGQLNTIQNDTFYATLGGGIANTIEPFAEQATIAGGGQGSIGTNASQATIGGGNANAIRAGSQGSTISGGTGNAIEAGALSGVIGGGSGNSILAGVASATVGGGFQNTILSGAAYAVIPGGRHALARLSGQAVHAAGRFAANGDAQTSTLVLRQQTTDATQQELFLDGPGGASQRITLASGSTWVFDILVVARSTPGASAGYAIRGVIENSGGTTAFVGSPAVTTLGEDTAAWEIAVEADNSLDALLIKATGEPATTIRWVATVRTVEVMQ